MSASKTSRLLHGKKCSWKGGRGVVVISHPICSSLSLDTLRGIRQNEQPCQSCAFLHSSRMSGRFSPTPPIKFPPSGCQRRKESHCCGVCYQGEYVACSTHREGYPRRTSFFVDFSLFLFCELWKINMADTK
jgi:hypothetical protein